MTETLSQKTNTSDARPVQADRRSAQGKSKSKPDIPGTGRSGRPALILATVLAGQFMALLDASIVNVAIPTIHTKLNASGAGLQMIVAGYIIAYAMGLVTGARLGRLHGQARMFKIGLVGFTIASLACGVAQNTGELIGFRVLQGLFGSVMIPQVLSLIQNTFQGEARAKAMSMWTAVLASGIVAGQVLGGLLVSANLFGWSWRPVFLVNVPIGAVLLFTAIRSLPGKTPDAPGVAHPRLDIVGVLILSPTILALVVPLVLGHDEHWPVWGWILLAAAVPLLGLFVYVEHRVAKNGGSPLLPRKVLKMPGMKPSLGVMFTMLTVYAGNLFATAIHLQTVLGFSALHTGLAFAPSATVFGLISYNWRRIPAQHVRSMTIVGSLVAILGIAAQVYLFRDGGYGGMWFYIDQAVVGFGVGLGNAPNMTLALMKVPVEDASDASGLLTTTSQLAQVVGISTLGTVYLTLAARPGLHAAGHAMAVMSAAATLVIVVCLGFTLQLWNSERDERRAAAATAG